MKKVSVFIIAIIIAACQGTDNQKAHRSAGFSATNERDRNKQEFADEIRIEQPSEDAVITSPLLIKGEIKGSWFFEAEFLIELVKDGKTIAQAIAKAESNWMTSDFVPFTANMEFPEDGSGEEAYLLFKNSNASGKPELDKSYRLAVIIGK